jgi:pseudo-rSAM protein
MTFSGYTELSRKFPEKVTWAFTVTSTGQHDFVSSFLEEAGIKNYTIIPLYTGRNRKFFEENVYITQDELDDIQLSKREVFANMTLNIHFFGKLTVMPDRKIYSNVNDPPLGTIGDPIYDMIYKEMTERKTWFRLRDMKPCCDCVYQWLCPTPSNYESVIGKPNLCHVNAY